MQLDNCWHGEIRKSLATDLMFLTSPFLWKVKHIRIYPRFIVQWTCCIWAVSQIDFICISALSDRCWFHTHWACVQCGMCYCVRFWAVIKAIFKATHVFVFVHLTHITRWHIIQNLEDGILRMGTVSGKILCIHPCHVNTPFMCMLLKHPPDM